jgi:hypothetical protein
MTKISTMHDKQNKLHTSITLVITEVNKSLHRPSTHGTSK